MTQDCESFLYVEVRGQPGCHSSDAVQSFGCRLKTESVTGLVTTSPVLLLQACSTMSRFYFILFIYLFLHGLWKLNSGSACKTSTLLSFFSLCSNLHLWELSYQSKATQLVGESNTHEQVPPQLHHAVWWIMIIGPTPWLWLWIKGKQETWASG